MGTKPKETKEQTIFSLFDRGFTPKAPEIKKLVPRYTTRIRYHSDWKKARGLSQGKGIINESESAKTELPLGESAAALHDIPSARQEKPSPQKTEPEPPQEEEPPPENEVEKMFTEPGDHEEEADEKTEEKPAGTTVGGAKVSAIKDKALALSKQIPTSVAGEGFIITIQVSTKTMALYDIARAMQKKLGKTELAFGDFVDDAVEDFFKGRGWDYGLVAIGGNGHGQ